MRLECERTEEPVCSLCGQPHTDAARGVAKPWLVCEVEQPADTDVPLVTAKLCRLLTCVCDKCQPAAAAAAGAEAMGPGGGADTACTSPPWSTGQASGDALPNGLHGTAGSGDVGSPHLYVQAELRFNCDYTAPEDEPGMEPRFTPEDVRSFLVEPEVAAALSSTAKELLNNLTFDTDSLGQVADDPDSAVLVEALRMLAVWVQEPPATADQPGLAPEPGRVQAPLEEPRAPLRQRLLRWASEVLESDFIRTSRIAPRPAVRLLHDGDQGKPRWSVWQLLHAPPYSHSVAVTLLHQAEDSQDDQSMRRSPLPTIILQRLVALLRRRANKVNVEWQITPGKLLRELQCQELLYSVARGASAGAAGAVQGAAGRLGAAGGTQRAYALLRDLNTDAETVCNLIRPDVALDGNFALDGNIACCAQCGGEADDSRSQSELVMCDICVDSFCHTCMRSTPGWDDLANDPWVCRYCRHTLKAATIEDELAEVRQGRQRQQAVQVKGEPGASEEQLDEEEDGVEGEGAEERRRLPLLPVTATATQRWSWRLKTWTLWLWRPRVQAGQGAGGGAAGTAAAAPGGGGGAGAGHAARPPATNRRQSGASNSSADTVAPLRPTAVHQAAAAAVAASGPAAAPSVSVSGGNGSSAAPGRRTGGGVSGGRLPSGRQADAGAAVGGDVPQPSFNTQAAARELEALQHAATPGYRARPQAVQQHDAHGSAGAAVALAAGAATAGTAAGVVAGVGAAANGSGPHRSLHDVWNAVVSLQQQLWQEPMREQVDAFAKFIFTRVRKRCNEPEPWLVCEVEQPADTDVHLVTAKLCRLLTCVCDKCQAAAAAAAGAEPAQAMGQGGGADTAGTSPPRSAGQASGDALPNGLHGTAGSGDVGSPHLYVQAELRFNCEYTAPEDEPGMVPRLARRYWVALMPAAAAAAVGGGLPPNTSLRVLSSPEDVRSFLEEAEVAAALSSTAKELLNNLTFDTDSLGQVADDPDSAVLVEALRMVAVWVQEPLAVLRIKRPRGVDPGWNCVTMVAREEGSPLRQRLLPWSFAVLSSSQVRHLRGLPPRPALCWLDGGAQGKRLRSVWELLHAPPNSSSSLIPYTASAERAGAQAHSGSARQHRLVCRVRAGSPLQEDRQNEVLRGFLLRHVHQARGAQGAEARKTLDLQPRLVTAAGDVDAVGWVAVWVVAKANWQTVQAQTPVQSPAALRQVVLLFMRPPCLHRRVQAGQGAGGGAAGAAAAALGGGGGAGAGHAARPPATNRRQSGASNSTDGSEGPTGAGREAAGASRACGGIWRRRGRG
eukprot:XP_001702620.1 predicted protein [Chlamydomonas reinhardtii]